MASTSSFSLKLTCMALVVCMALGSATLANAMSCGQVASYVAPCISYLRGGGQIPSNCCSGVRSLNSAASSTDDRQNACRCLLAAAGNIEGLDPNLVAGLPSACGVSLPFKLTTSTNCNSIR